jgi:uncharacterized cysteine cluster protein YcgN (CxxCxxCC family)
MGVDPAFWKGKRPEEMTPQEWEMLCDGCGWCCMHKFEDRDSGKIFYTCVSCRLFNTENCRCRSYRRRKSIVSNCLVMTPELAASKWLPRSCAYRLISEGRPLPSWHPLVSGTLDTVHAAGMSVRGLAVSEKWIHKEDFSSFIIADDT